MQRYLVFFIVTILLILPFNLAWSASVNYSAGQLSAGATFQAYQEDFQLAIPQGQYNSLEVYVFEKPAINLPENLKLISKVYDYYLVSTPTAEQSIFTITIGYQSESLYAKNIFKWDYQEKVWLLQPSTVNFEAQTVKAQVVGNKGKVLVFESLNLNTADQQINYQDQFYISLPETVNHVQTLTKIESFSDLTYPETKIRTSDIYQFDVKAEQALDLSKPIELTIKLQDSNNNRQVIYYWDNNQNSWIYLPSWTNYYERTVSAYIHLPFARLALFIEPNQFVGEASWYAFRGGPYAASRDYPKGTKLKVTNITKDSKNFGKAVIVTVNDYGPAEWTGRLIDLDKVAYSKIGYLSGGVMPVMIEVVE